MEICPIYISLPPCFLHSFLDNSAESHLVFQLALDSRLFVPPRLVGNGHVRFRINAGSNGCSDERKRACLCNFLPISLASGAGRRDRSDRVDLFFFSDTSRESYEKRNVLFILLALCSTRRGAKPKRNIHVLKQHRHYWMTNIRQLLISG